MPPAHSQLTYAGRLDDAPKALGRGSRNVDRPGLYAYSLRSVPLPSRPPPSKGRPMPNELFSPLNIAALGVATAAVNVVTNTLHRLLNAPPKWTAFVAALVVSYLAVALKESAHWSEWVLGFFNACLLFCTAFGMNESAAALSSSERHVVAAKEFFGSWKRP